MSPSEIAGDLRRQRRHLTPPAIVRFLRAQSAGSDSENESESESESNSESEIERGEKSESKRENERASVRERASERERDVRPRSEAGYQEWEWNGG